MFYFTFQLCSFHEFKKPSFNLINKNYHRSNLFCHCSTYRAVHYGPLWSLSRMRGDRDKGAPLKIRYTHPTMMILRTVVIQILKNLNSINKLRERLFEFCWFSIFDQKLTIFIISGSKDEKFLWKYNLWFFFTIIKFIKAGLINMIAILMTVKLATPDLLKISVLWCDKSVKTNIQKIFRTISKSG